MEQNNTENLFKDGEDSGFDIMEWVSAFLNHWYLFVIGIILSLGLAYLENRSWKPTYQTAGTIMIEDYKYVPTGTQSLMQGFGVQSGYRNTNNQVLMLGSNDLIGRVIDSLPFLKVDYISKGSFKTRNLYRASPVIIHSDYVSPEAYNLQFKLRLRSNGTFRITVEDNKLLTNFKIEGVYGQPIQHNMFFITINNVNKFMGNKDMYFTFRTRESLISDFSSRIQFGFVVEGSSVLQISLIGDTPERDIDFIDKLCDLFLGDNLDRKNDAATKTVHFINGQLGKVAKALNNSEGDMTGFRQRNNLVDVASHGSQLLEKASKYEQMLSDLRLRETYLDYLSRYLRTNLADGAVIAPSSLGLNEPLLMASVQQINELYYQRAEVTQKNMYYGKYTKQIDNTKLTVLEVVKNMRVALELEKADVNRRYALVLKQMNGLPGSEIQMNAIERELKMNDNYYTFFLQKRAEAEILKASNTPDNTILDRARILTITNADKKQKTTLMFLLFGILLPTLFVVMKELLNSTIRSTRDVEKNCDFPLIGAVRHTKSTDPLLVSKNPRSAFTEMFRIIRTRVEFLVKRKTNIVIMVTSAESGDGKTYFAINLTSIYSMASKKTLLIDMDIRKPSVNQRFNIIQPNGVTNYLVGQCTLDEVIFQLPKADFDILPAGSIPPNPGELIRSEKINEMLDELRKRYDYIIIDSSPIGMVTDAYSLARLSDINLFVARNAKTNKAGFKRICSQLKQDKLPNIYTVLNDVADDGSKYSRYKLYKYAYLFGNTYGYTNTKTKKGGKDKFHEYYEDDSEI
ncbi:MAG: polysaccharide biosynthesis tyrosine autokinase [Paludibacter sp.]